MNIDQGELGKLIPENQSKLVQSAMIAPALLFLNNFAEKGQDSFLTSDIELACLGLIAVGLGILISYLRYKRRRNAPS